MTGSLTMTKGCEYEVSGRVAVRTLFPTAFKFAPLAPRGAPRDDISLNVLTTATHAL